VQVSDGRRVLDDDVDVRCSHISFVIDYCEVDGTRAWRAEHMLAARAVERRRASFKRPFDVDDLAIVA
jgi:hypothetical protein